MTFDRISHEQQLALARRDLSDYRELTAELRTQRDMQQRTSEHLAERLEQERVARHAAEKVNAEEVLRKRTNLYLQIESLEAQMADRVEYIESMETCVRRALDVHMPKILNYLPRGRGELGKERDAISGAHNMLGSLAGLETWLRLLKKGANDA